MLTKKEIKTLRETPGQITRALIDALREKGNDGKHQALQLLDMDKNREQFYIDAFGNRISFMGNRGLKDSYVQFELTPLHLEEIERCQTDIHYFKDNYIQIITPGGVDFPSTRSYQDEFIDLVSDDETTDFVQLMPRQCCSAETVIYTQEGKKTLGELYNELQFLSTPVNYNVKDDVLIKGSSDLSLVTRRKFVASVQGQKYEVLTPMGYKEILCIHKTVPYQKFRVTLQNGIQIDVQGKHVFITSNGYEVYQQDSMHVELQTTSGPQIVTRVEYLGYKETMYDISIDSQDELYYSNDILSHNSGKSVSTQMYLSWLYNFKKDINIGIVQNRGKTAREFLDKTKQIIINLPIWLQPGTEVWNKTEIENEYGTKIMTDVPSVDSFRGSSISCLVVDECLHGNETVTIRHPDNPSGAMKIKLKDVYNFSKDHERTLKFANSIIFSDFEVLTSNGFKKFHGINRIPKKSAIKLEFRGKEPLIITEDHMFYMDEYRGGIKASELEPGDYLQSYQITAVTKLLYRTEEYFYDLLEVVDGNHYTASGFEHENCQFIRTSIWHEFQDSIFPAQSGLQWKKNILLSTQNGQNHFFDIVEGAREDINGFVNYEMDWKEVPRYNSDGTVQDPMDFKKQTVQKYGEQYWNQNYECLSGDQKVTIKLKDGTIKNMRLDDLALITSMKNRNLYK